MTIVVEWLEFFSKIFLKQSTHISVVQQKSVLRQKESDTFKSRALQGSSNESLKRKKKIFSKYADCRESLLKTVENCK